MSNGIWQTWKLAGGTSALDLQLTSNEPFPGDLIKDLAPVVAAIEEFLETWGYHPPMPDWERQLLSNGETPA